MQVFGPYWNDHVQRVAEGWRARVGPQDGVLLVGDLSWAMTLAQAEADLRFVSELPGRKYLVRGNHDYWWPSSGNQVAAALPESMQIIDHHKAVVTHIGGRQVGMAGTRGWLSPPFPDENSSDGGVTWEEHEKIYRRELGRLESSLNQLSTRPFGPSAGSGSPPAPGDSPRAESRGGSPGVAPASPQAVLSPAARGCEPVEGRPDVLIVALHFPPFSALLGRSGFIDLAEEHGARICVYGHMHGLAARRRFEGDIHGIEYFCASCDVLDFKPVRIL